MRVLHSGTLDTNAGGPAMSTYFTLLGLRQLGVEAEIIMFPLSKGGRLRGEEVPVHFTAAPVIPKILYSPVLRRDIRALGPFDIYHAQGIWQYSTYALVDEARRAGKPYVITPRGMLYPQDIAKSNASFKRLSLQWRLLRDLNGAACVHVTCEDERDHCRRLGITAPIAVIPNPVDIHDYPPPVDDGTFRFGYLGRVSRRKNIHGLIEAYRRLGPDAAGTELLIIGDGDADYREELHWQAAQVEHGQVRFTGFLNGEDKDQAIASLSVLVMPSEFENFGMVVTEALARRIPCIATTGAPWRELQTHHCGWWIPYEQEALNATLRQALTTPPAHRSDMGLRGRQLVEQRYSIEQVARDMVELYKSLG